MMPAPGEARSNTVTLALGQGESANSTATFSPMMSARQVTVGSGTNAQWKVRAQGVEPVHAELYWDGSVAFVRDAGSLSGVYVGVERIEDWRQLYDGDEVLFGDAVLRVRAVGPDARPPSVHPVGGIVGFPRAPASASFLEEESTMIFQGGANAKSQDPRSVASPTIAPMSTGPSVPPPRSATAQETVIRMSPYADAVPTSGEATMMNTDLPAHLLAPPPTVASAYLIPANAPNATAPMGAPSPSHGAFPMLATEAMAVRPPGAMMDSAGLHDDPFGVIPPPPGSTDVPHPTDALDALAIRLKTTRRVLVMGGATLVVALCALVYPTPPPPAPREQLATGHPTPSSRAITPNPGLQILTTPALPPATNNILRLPMGPSGLVGVILPAPMGGTDSWGHPIALPVANPSDPILLAADAVATHHWADAIQRYDALATLHPEAPLFRHFAIVLRARTAAANCTHGDPGCVAPPTTVTPGS